MQISNSSVTHLTHECHILEELLSLEGKTVLELGCGKAEKTRIVAQKAALVTALEVDEFQHAKNTTITDLHNVSFVLAGAEKIPATAAIYDVVTMFKSLHHVPTQLLDTVFSEIHRVLKPEGIAYISEPVYAGTFNDILKIFHDEKAVREAAFSAVKRATSSGKLELMTQRFFLEPLYFEDFSQFQERVIGVTHTSHNLSPEQLNEVRLSFNKHMTPKGVEFQMPIRVDLLRKLDA